MIFIRFPNVAGIPLWFIIIGRKMNQFLGFQRGQGEAMLYIGAL